MNEIVNLAQEIAIEAHEGQVDKLGEPYIDHPTRVVKRLWSQTGVSNRDVGLDVAAGWLHDVVEDTPWTRVGLRRHGGRVLPAGLLYDWDQVITAVRHLTHAKGEPNVEYWQRITECERAVRVKLADIADNSDPRRLAYLDDETIVRLVRKYAKAKRVLLRE